MNRKIFLITLFSLFFIGSQGGFSNNAFQNKRFLQNCDSSCYRCSTYYSCTSCRSGYYLSGNSCYYNYYSSGSSSTGSESAVTVLKAVGGICIGICSIGLVICMGSLIYICYGQIKQGSAKNGSNSANNYMNPGIPMQPVNYQPEILQPNQIIIPQNNT